MGDIEQSFGLYVFGRLIKILAGLTVERAEQFAVPVDEKFINCRTFVTAVSVKTGLWTTTIGEVSYSGDSDSR